SVGQDDGDAGGLRLVEHGVPSGLDNRGERDVVDALLDVRADRLDLVLLLLLSVGELQLDTGLFEGRLDVLGVGGTPSGLRADLSEADDELVERLALSATRGITASAVAAGRAAGEAEQQHTGRSDRNELLHG